MKFQLPLAISRKALVNAFKTTDISVSGRLEGRTNDQTETWVICRLLATLSHHDYLRFPIRIQGRERPDFFVCQRFQKYGLEITEAIPTIYSKFIALRDREFPGKWIEPAHFQMDMEHMSTDDMRKLLQQNKLTSDGWVGDKPEQEWADFLKLLIENKTKKLGKSGFERFPRNWLAIYDNMPYHALHLRDAVALLENSLSRYWDLETHFDTIFVEHGPMIVLINQKGSSHFELIDLWE